MMTYFTSEQMTQEITKETLPAIVSDLLFATTNKFSEFRIPTSNLTGKFGFDGIIEIPDDVETSLIPTGKLKFEMSVQGDVKAKCEKDYNKRTQGVKEGSLKDVTYITVTSQLFNKKDAWIQEKKAAKDFPWKDLLCFDQEDLYAWFNLCPSVAIKWGEIWGIEINSLYTLNSVLERWSEIFENTLEKETLSSLIHALNHEENSDAKLLDFFNGRDSKFVITASSVEEARLYVAAILDKDKKQRASNFKGKFFLDKVICIEKTEIFQKLPLKQYTGLVFLTSLQNADFISKATQYDIKIIQVLRHLYTHENANIELPIRINSDSFFNVLQKNNMETEKIQELARKSGRNITTLRSVIANEPLPWTQEAPSPALLAALLVGGWSSEKEDDKTVLCTLSGIDDYASFTQELVQYLNKENSPIQHEKPYYRSISSFSAFPALKHYITTEFFEKYKDICISILTKDDQVKNLPYSEQPFALLKNIENDFSPLLRRSMADSLIHLSLLYDDEKHVIDNIVTTICKGDIVRWKSIAPYILELAEASPSAYLNMLENLIQTHGNELKELVNSTHHTFESYGDYTSILFSLELLAWDEKYLEKITKILLELIPIWDNIPNNVMNTPLSILSKIYCIWYPQTQAAVIKRNAVLQRLLNNYPNERCLILLKLLPQACGTMVTSGVRPKWKIENIKPEERTVMYEEYESALCKIFEISLKYCHENIDLILRLIEMSCHSQVSSKNIELFQNKLNEMTLTEEKNYVFWKKLRNFLLNEIRYNLNSCHANLLQYFIQKYNDFEPTDMYKKNIHYFTDPFNCMEVDENPDFHNVDAKVIAKQKEAIINIYSSKNNKGIVEFLCFLSEPENMKNCYNANNAVAYIFEHLFSIGLDASSFDELLLMISSSDSVPTQFKLTLCKKYAEAYLGTDIEKNIKFFEIFGVDFLNQYLLSVPFSVELFDYLRTAKESLQEYYWKNISENHLAYSSYKKEIIQQLILFGNFSVSCRLLAIFYKELNDFDLISKTLEGLLATKNTYYSTHDIGLLFDRVVCTEEEHEKMMILEWQFFQILKNKSKRIYKEMARNPNYFMMFISYAFKSSKSEKIEVAQEVSRQAYSILKATSVNHAPLLNAFRDENGVLHFEALFDWFSSVREIANSQGYGEIAIPIAAEHLAYSSKIYGLNTLFSHDNPETSTRENEVFPEEAIRQLLNCDAFQDVRDAYITSFLSRFGAWGGSGVSHYSNIKTIVEENLSKISPEDDLLCDMFEKLLESIDGHIKWHKNRDKHEDMDI